MRSPEETIAAVATPPGEGGIAIVRVSGPRAADVARSLLREAGRGDPPTLEPRRAHLCRVADPADGRLLDEALALFMPGPASYTREDLLEIQCHGGRAAAAAVLDAALRAGARLAEPGEFTLRAFLGGRIDLVQAEAVADLIHAETADSLAVHESLLEGSLSREVEGWQEALGAALVELEAALDFPEEELDLGEGADLARTLAPTVDAMAGKLDSFAWGRTAREGYRVAILGAPNVGKSSLLNRLAEEDHAIVSDIAGTTRDVIEVRVNALGAPVRVVDTAGLRRGGDPVEEEGVARARRAAERADLVLFLFDGSRDLDPAEAEEARGLARGRRVEAVIHKADLGELPRAAVRDLFGAEPLAASAKTGEGIETLLARIRDHAWSGAGPRGEGALTRLRHREAVARAHAAAEEAVALLREGRAPDAAASLLQEARRHLASLLGWGTPEEVLDRIFAEFCIGK